MVLKPLLLIILFAAIGWADTGFKDTIQFTETDNFPKCQAGQVKVSPGTLTCNGQTATIATGGSSSLPLPGGATNYIQSTLTPTTTTQSFSVQVGSFSVAGWYIMDSSNCLWNTTIATTGNLVTTLVNCPPVTTFVPCVPGVPYGLLLSLTCPRS